MLIRMLILNVINTERKILTRHKIIDRISEQIVLVITRVCKESMTRNLRRSSFSFTYLFKFTYFCFADVWNLKKECCLRK